ncbi:MAG: hypothetical protein QXT64_08055 [Desulfurococcaceae archaeon]
MGDKLDKMIDAVFKLVYGPPAQESVSTPELKKIQTAGDVVAKLAEVAVKMEGYELYVQRVSQAVENMEENIKKTQVFAVLALLFSIISILMTILIR